MLMLPPGSRVFLATDPVDQLIVATALVHRAALVTADAKILEWRHTLVRHDAAR